MSNKKELATLEFRLYSLKMYGPYIFNSERVTKLRKELEGKIKALEAKL